MICINLTTFENFTIHKDKFLWSPLISGDGASVLQQCSTLMARSAASAVEIANTKTATHTRTNNSATNKDQTVL